MAAMQTRSEHARTAALRARDEGHEVVWLAEAALEVIVAAAAQECPDEVWLDATDSQRRAVLDALRADGLYELRVSNIPETEGKNAV